MPGSELHGEALALYDLLLRPATTKTSEAAFFDAVNVPETVIFDPQGRICRWVFTAADGSVRARSQRAMGAQGAPSLAEVERRFSTHAQWESSYGCNVTAVEERARPRLLDKHALHDALRKIAEQTDLYADHRPALEGGSDDGGSAAASAASSRRAVGGRGKSKSKRGAKELPQRGPLRATAVPVCLQRFFAPKDGVRYSAVLQGLPSKSRDAAEDERVAAAAAAAENEGLRKSSSPFAAAASARRRAREASASDQDSHGGLPHYMRPSGQMRVSQRRALSRVSSDALNSTWAEMSSRTALPPRSVVSGVSDDDGEQQPRCRWRVAAKRQTYMVTHASRGRVGGTSSLVSHFSSAAGRKGRPGSRGRSKNALAQTTNSLDAPSVAQWLEREIARTSTEVWRWIRDAHGIELESLETKFVCDRFSTLHLVGMHSPHVCQLLRAASSPRKQPAPAHLAQVQVQLQLQAIKARGEAAAAAVAMTAVSSAAGTAGGALTALTTTSPAPLNAIEAGIQLVLPVDMKVGLQKKSRQSAATMKRDMEKMLSAKTAGESLVSKIRGEQARAMLRITSLEKRRAEDKANTLTFVEELVQAGPMAKVTENVAALVAVGNKAESIARRITHCEERQIKAASSVKEEVRKEIQRTAGAMQELVDKADLIDGRIESLEDKFSPDAAVDIYGTIMSNSETCVSFSSTLAAYDTRIEELEEQVATRDDRLRALEQTMLTREALLEVEREQQNDRIAHLERIFGGLSEQLAAIGYKRYGDGWNEGLGRGGFGIKQKSKAERSTTLKKRLKYIDDSTRSLKKVGSTVAAKASAVAAFTAVLKRKPSAPGRMGGDANSEASKEAALISAAPPRKAIAALLAKRRPGGVTKAVVAPAPEPEPMAAVAPPAAAAAAATAMEPAVDEPAEASEGKDEDLPEGADMSLFGRLQRANARDAVAGAKAVASSRAVSTSSVAMVPPVEARAAPTVAAAAKPSVLSPAAEVHQAPIVAPKYVPQPIAVKRLPSTKVKFKKGEPVAPWTQENSLTSEDGILAASLV